MYTYLRPHIFCRLKPHCSVAWGSFSDRVFSFLRPNTAKYCKYCGGKKMNRVCSGRPMILTPCPYDPITWVKARAAELVTVHSTIAWIASWVAGYLFLVSGAPTKHMAILLIIICACVWRHAGGAIKIDYNLCLCLQARWWRNLIVTQFNQLQSVPVSAGTLVTVHNINFMNRLMAASYNHSPLLFTNWLGACPVRFVWC